MTFIEQVVLVVRPNTSTLDKPWYESRPDHWLTDIYDEFPLHFLEISGLALHLKLHHHCVCPYTSHFIFHYIYSTHAASVVKLTINK